MRTLKLTIFLGAVLVFANKAYSHEGHDHAPGVEAESVIGDNQIITITPQARENLALQTEQASIRDLEVVLNTFGTIRAIPQQTAAITSRISGKVRMLKVSEGDKVKKDDSIIVIESRQIGDPPPLVEYRSPFDGIITSRYVIAGDAVEPEVKLFEVSDLREVYGEMNIFQDQLPNIKLGQKVIAVVGNETSQRYVGSVERIAGSFDQATSSLKVWARFENSGFNLLPNMMARYRVVISTTQSAITIPKSAVLGEMGEFFVFIQSENGSLEFKKTAVVVGESSDQYVEIIEGVLPGDEVVTVGNYQLQYLPASNKEEAEEDTVDEESEND